MKQRTRGLALIFILLLTISMLFACDKGNQAEVSKQAESQVETQEETPENDVQVSEAPENNTGDIDAAGVTEAAEVTEAVDATPAAENTVDPNTQTTDGQVPSNSEKKEIRDIPSTQLVKEIKIGWNLGNTMDATGGNGVNSESSWGNPVTTKEMIDTVKEAGFNTVRIPTTWEKHLGPAPDYTIDAAWLDRVQEIVDYVMDNDMFAIINMHHEEWYFPSYDNADAAKDILTKVWKQIADRFENYDEHLIFEGLNEPRMKGTNFEWNGGNEEGRDVINQFNAAFIETIRNAGGNNPLRHLMIPPYAASSDTKTWSEFIVPEDDKLIVSIHAYAPYNFALNGAGTATWSIDNASDTRDIDNLMNNIYNNFVSKGIPVIIGEFGGRNKDNLESRVAWAQYYIKKAAEKGIPCIWWDNGSVIGSGENFGLLNRKFLKWEFPDIVTALMNGLE